MNKSARQSRIRKCFRRATTRRAAELIASGLGRYDLTQALASGDLVQTGRGLYSRADSEVTERHTYAQVCHRYPRAVICLLSALRFHELSTQNPAQVWIAIGEKDWSPRSDFVELRVVRFSERCLHEGVESHSVEGTSVKVTSVARTVADLFKYRNKLGLEIALEALREGLRERRCTPRELTEAAEVCRVQRVMRPYLESLV